MVRPGTVRSPELRSISASKDRPATNPVWALSLQLTSWRLCTVPMLDPSHARKHTCLQEPGGRWPGPKRPVGNSRKTPFFSGLSDPPVQSSLWPMRDTSLLMLQINLPLGVIHSWLPSLLTANSSAQASRVTPRPGRAAAAESSAAHPLPCPTPPVEIRRSTSYLLLVARPGAPSSFLAPSSDARSP